MPGQIICARCGKVLSNWDLSQGHECSRFYYGRWEIREEESVLWEPDNPNAPEDIAGEAAGGTGAEERFGLKECPRCHETSLGFNTILLLWECLNRTCQARVANDDMDPGAAGIVSTK
ncbi:MAG: hypothetical protein HYY32_05255 [Chloroflexi bacterium]|nr:hypothetical protein [Chloroflexota bacterium]